MVTQICALHEAWDADKYGFRPNPAERYSRWLEQQTTSDRSLFPVAEREATDSLKSEREQASELVAFLVATIETEIPIDRLKEFGFIHDLWVEPGYCQLGLGKQLAEQTLQNLRQKGISQVRLDTAVVNESHDA